MLNTDQLSRQLGVSDRQIQRITKAAAENSQSVIIYNDERYLFEKRPAIGGRGWVYAYKPVLTPARKPKRKVKTSYKLNPNLLPEIANLNKPTTDEKIALVGFYNTSNNPLGVIVKALLIKHDSNIKPESLQAKIKRWAKTFKEKGRAGLEDKRGGKEFKADLELVKKAILAGGTRHYTSLYFVYCQFYAAKQDLELNYRNPTSDISESAFVNSVKHLRENDEMINQYLMYGQDAFRYMHPSFHNVWEYPNQQWEVDATPLDLMVKVPLDANGNKDFHSRDTDSSFDVLNLGDTNARVVLVRVMDNYTKASVHMVVQSSNSNANARLLYKAFGMLGMPEVIRSDQGSDYISGHLQGVIETLGITPIILPPARGDQKGTVERSFRTDMHSALFENLPGFIGHNVNQRQHLENEASTKLDKKSNVATNIKGDFMWWWQAEQWLDNYLYDVDADKYAQHEKHKLSEQQLSEIYRLMGKEHTRTVSKSGIRHNKTYYLDNELWAKHLTIGDKIQIRENMDDTTQVFVFKNNQYLGAATAQNIFMQSQTVEQSRDTQKAYKKRVVAKTKQRMHQAQKQYRGIQNKVRDEYLDIEAQNAKSKREQEQQEKATGTDSLRDYMRLVSVGKIN